MASDDLLPRRVTLKGREVWQLRAPDLEGRLTEVDCGLWASGTLGITQADVVVRMAAAKGFPLTADNAVSLIPSEDDVALPLPLSGETFARAVRWVNDHGPTGYHLGMKLMDLWYVPEVWWEDTGGDELADGDSGLEGDWGLAELDEEA